MLVPVAEASQSRSFPDANHGQIGYQCFELKQDWTMADSPKRTNVLKQFLPKGFRAWASIIMGGYALLGTIDLAYDQGLNPVYQLGLDFYRDVVEIIFRPVRGPVERLLKSLFDIRLDLHPMWIHVSFLCAIYLMRNVWRLYGTGRFFMASYQLVVALPVMLFSGVGAAVFYNENSLFSEFFVTLFPIIGVFLMALAQGAWFASNPTDRIHRAWPDFGGSWTHFMKCQTLYGLHLLIGGIALSGTYTILLFRAGIPNPAILVLVLLILSLAFYWLVLGLLTYWKGRRGEIDKSSAEQPPGPFAHPATRLGIAMLQVVSACGAIIISDVGLDILRASL